jgi:hypothetical protein
MKEVTVKVPEHKVKFFMDLMKELGIEEAKAKEISEEHKNIVRERIKTEDPKEIVAWDKARNQFEYGKSEK